jgi:iron(III) transport system substrate-binding protein
MKILGFTLGLFWFLPILASEVTIYSARKEHLLKPIFDLYTKKTGVKINYLTDEAGPLLQRIKAEITNPKADILMTVDAGNLWYAKQEGIFDPIKSKVLMENIPSFLRDPDDFWFGFTIRVRTIVFNQTKVKKEDLTTYQSLAGPMWNKRLCLRSSKKVYNQSLITMLLHDLGEEETLRVLKGWVKNTVSIFNDDTAVLKAIDAGQCDVGIVNSYYYAKYLIDNKQKSNIAIFWPNQDSSGVHINVSGAGLLKGAKNKAAAIAFLEWLSTEEAQSSFAQLNYEYAIHSKVAQDPIVASWGKFKMNSSFNLSQIGELQSQAIKVIYKAGYK